MAIEIKTCPICGQEFEGNPLKIYCSYSCKNKAQYTQKKDYYHDYYQQYNKKDKNHQKSNNKKEKPILEKTCPTCGKIFPTHDTRKKYCCDECATESSKKQVQIQNDKKKQHFIKICPICNQEFETTRKNQIYCSQECGKQGQLIKERERSQTPEFKKDHIKRQNKYAIKKNPPVEKICPICGIAFSTTDYRKKYCNEECRYEAQKIRANKK